MPDDWFEVAWKNQGKVLKVLDSALPADLDVYAGGTGNRKFLDKVDLSTGFWRADTGRVRWIYHVVPDGAGFKVRLPGRPGATDLPGAMNTVKPPAKALLTYLTVALFQKADGSFEWPSGWQWLVYFLLNDVVPPNTAAKVHSVHPAGGRLRADRYSITFSDWGVLGVLPPLTAYAADGFHRPITYAEVGEAIAANLNALAPR